MLEPSEQFDELDIQPRLDRTKVAIFSSFEEAEAADKAYWTSCTPQERLRHMEVLRRMNYGSRATARLQRVLEFGNRR